MHQSRADSISREIVYPVVFLVWLRAAPHQYLLGRKELISHHIITIEIINNKVNEIRNA